MIEITTNDKLAPSGHYSQAIEHDGTIYISAQLPIDPLTGQKVYGTVMEETLRILNNIETILNEVALNRRSVIKTTVFVTDVNSWSQVNLAYSQFFNDHSPTRSILPVTDIHFGFKVAIESVAVT